MAESGIANTKTIATVSGSTTGIPRLAITVVSARVVAFWFCPRTCVLWLAAALSTFPLVRTLFIHVADLRRSATTSQLRVTYFRGRAVAGAEIPITFAVRIAMTPFTALSHIAVLIPKACGTAVTGFAGGG